MQQHASAQQGQQHAAHDVAHAGHGSRLQLLQVQAQHDFIQDCAGMASANDLEAAGDDAGPAPTLGQHSSVALTAAGTCRATVQPEQFPAAACKAVMRACGALQAAAAAGLQDPSQHLLQEDLPAERVPLLIAWQQQPAGQQEQLQQEPVALPCFQQDLETHLAKCAAAVSLPKSAQLSTQDVFDQLQAQLHADIASKATSVLSQWSARLFGSSVHPSCVPIAALLMPSHLQAWLQHMQGLMAQGPKVLHVCDAAAYASSVVAVLQLPEVQTAVGHDSLARMVQQLAGSAVFEAAAAAVEHHQASGLNTGAAAQPSSSCLPSVPVTATAAAPVPSDIRQALSCATAAAPGAEAYQQQPASEEEEQLQQQQQRQHQQQQQGGDQQAQTQLSLGGVLQLLHHRLPAHVAAEDAHFFASWAKLIFGVSVEELPMAALLPQLSSFMQHLGTNSGSITPRVSSAGTSPLSSPTQQTSSKPDISRQLHSRCAEAILHVLQQPEVQCCAEQAELQQLLQSVAVHLSHTQPHPTTATGGSRDQPHPTAAAVSSVTAADDSATRGAARLPCSIERTGKGAAAAVSTAAAGAGDDHQAAYEDVLPDPPCHPESELAGLASEYDTLQAVEAAYANILATQAAATTAAADSIMDYTAGVEHGYSIGASSCAAAAIPAAAAACPRAASASRTVTLSELQAYMVQQGSTAVAAWAQLAPLRRLSKLVKGPDVDPGSVTVTELLRHIDILLHFYRQQQQEAALQADQAQTSRQSSSSHAGQGPSQTMDNQHTTLESHTATRSFEGSCNSRLRHPSADAGTAAANRLQQCKTLWQAAVETWHLAKLLQMPPVQQACSSPKKLQQLLQAVKDAHADFQSAATSSSAAAAAMAAEALAAAAAAAAPDLKETAATAAAAAAAASSPMEAARTASLADTGAMHSNSQFVTEAQQCVQHCSPTAAAHRVTQPRKPLGDSNTLQEVRGNAQQPPERLKQQMRHELKDASAASGRSGRESRKRRPSFKVLEAAETADWHLGRPKKLPSWPAQQQSSAAAGQASVQPAASFARRPDGATAATKQVQLLSKAVPAKAARRYTAPEPLTLTAAGTTAAAAAAAPTPASGPAAAQVAAATKPAVLRPAATATPSLKAAVAALLAESNSAAAAPKSAAGAGAGSILQGVPVACWSRLPTTMSLAQLQRLSSRKAGPFASQAAQAAMAPFELLAQLLHGSSVKAYEVQVASLLRHWDVLYENLLAASALDGSMSAAGSDSGTGSGTQLESEAWEAPGTATASSIHRASQSTGGALGGSADRAWEDSGVTAASAVVPAAAAAAGAGGAGAAGGDSMHAAFKHMSHMRAALDWPEVAALLQGRQEVQQIQSELDAAVSYLRELALTEVHGELPQSQPQKQPPASIQDEHRVLAASGPATAPRLIALGVMDSSTSALTSEVLTAAGAALPVAASNWLSASRTLE